MTDQQNPFSTMPEPPQAFDNAQGQGQAAQSYDTDQTAQQAYDPYQAQQPYGAGQGSVCGHQLGTDHAHHQLCNLLRSRPTSRCTPSPWPRRPLQLFTR